MSDFVVRAFVVFFVTYLLSLAIHFSYFGLQQESLRNQQQLNRGHPHELAADTPLHKYLKHSHSPHESEDLSGISKSSWRDAALAHQGNLIDDAAGSSGSHDDEQLHAKLVCEGSEDGSEQDLVYWHAPTPEDDNWVSPWKPTDGSKQYVTFESDNGGWNNVRMALEAIFVFARATGRTVVMPPDEAFYFPDPGVDKKDYFQHSNGYDDFFPLEEMRKRLGPDSVISMQEFLEREAYPGHLGRVPPVPLAKMNDPAVGLHGRKLRDYIRSLASLPNTTSPTTKQPGGQGLGIGPGGEKLSEAPVNDNPAFFMPKFKEGGRLGCLAFPAHPGDPVLTSTKTKNQKANAKVEAAPGADPAVVQRLTNFAAGREVLPLNGPFLSAKVVHFAAWPKAGFRVLMHFYTLFFFADESFDRRMKRFVRDHFRYHDHVWCAAHRVTSLVREDARSHYLKQQQQQHPLPLLKGGGGGGGGSGSGGGVAEEEKSVDNRGALEGGSFSTFHIRHGEFQFKVVRLGAEEIVANTRDLLVPGELLYVATDEKDKALFFQPLRDAGYELRFLDDYFEAAGLGALESNMLGMVDTLVAAQGRHFVGTWFSTFSGYIIRLRGYARHHLHAGKARDVGDDSFYFFLKKKFAMRSREAPSDPFYTREWPTAWEDLDE